MSEDKCHVCGIEFKPDDYKVHTAKGDSHIDGYACVAVLLPRLAKAREALKHLTLAIHEGNGGFCYEPHGTRKCSCHVSTAREALAELDQ